MEAVYSSKMLVLTYHTKWCYNPEYSNINRLRMHMIARNFSSRIKWKGGEVGTNTPDTVVDKWDAVSWCHLFGLASSVKMLCIHLSHFEEAINDVCRGPTVLHFENTLKASIRPVEISMGNCSIDQHHSWSHCTYFTAIQYYVFQPLMELWNHDFTEYACHELESSGKTADTKLESITICTKQCCCLEVCYYTLSAKVDTAVPVPSNAIYSSWHALFLFIITCIIHDWITSASLLHKWIIM
jgi:hypothetical protein